MSRLPALALLATSAFALAACGSSYSTSGTPTPPTTPPTTSATPSSTASTTTLATATTSLGSVVVDGHGMTVYVYDQDTKGARTSACAGGCLAAWPPVEVTGTPTVTGVSGTVATIPAPDGGRQITLDGWPLYTYSGDAAAGDVTGQGSGGVWWAVGPDGTKITSAGPTATTGGAPYGGGNGGY